MDIIIGKIVEIDLEKYSEKILEKNLKNYLKYLNIYVIHVEKGEAKVSSINGRKRKYLSTHPWINFQIDYRKFDYELWMLLGEAQSKCEHIAGTPLKPAIADDLHKVYIIKGAVATTAIEGNTLTEEEAMDILEKKTKLPPSQEYLGTEIENIVNTLNKGLDWIKSGKSVDINKELINDLNRDILKNLELREDVVPGEIRTHSVVAGQYRGAPAEDCEFLINKYCMWLRDESFSLGTGYSVASSILKAIIAHLYFVWIHPFGDGNGRTARLLETFILLDAGVPAPAAHLLSNHYNKTRSKYYIELDKSSKIKDVSLFIKYALIGFVDGLRDQIQGIKNQMMNVSWVNYIHEEFKGKESPAQKRKRQLILDLSKFDKPLTSDEFFNNLAQLSPSVAKDYLRKSPKTIKNDISDLLKLGLIRFVDDGKIIVNKEKMSAFLPVRKTVK